MKVFLSWSGDRSQKVAEAFHAWLRLTVQSVDPWMSKANIQKGARWGPEIADQLEGAKIGIACLTADNLGAPWILFEGGAIAKTKDALLCTFLLDIRTTDVEPPLGQFQATAFNRDEIFALLQTIISRVREIGETAPSDEAAKTLFDMCWPDLEKRLKAAAGAAAPAQPRRNVEDILQEILEGVRRLGRERQDELEQEMQYRKKLERDAVLALLTADSPYTHQVAEMRQQEDKSGSIGDRLNRLTELVRSIDLPVKDGK